MQYALYDIIQSTKQIAPNIPQNTHGTILHIYETLPQKYEVEFFDTHNTSLDCQTVTESDIMPLNQKRNRHN